MARKQFAQANHRFFCSKPELKTESLHLPLNECCCCSIFNEFFFWPIKIINAIGGNLFAVSIKIIIITGCCLPVSFCSVMRYAKIQQTNKQEPVIIDDDYNNRNNNK